MPDVREAMLVPPLLRHDPFILSMRSATTLCKPPFLFRSPPVTPLAQLRTSRLIPNTVETNGSAWSDNRGQHSHDRGSKSTNDAICEHFFGGHPGNTVSQESITVPSMPRRPIQRCDLTPGSRAKLSQEMLSRPNVLRSPDSCSSLSRHGFRYYSFKTDVAWKMMSRKDYNSVNDSRPWQDPQGRVAPLRGRP